MAKNTIQALVLAAGKGTRMRSELPKVLHQVWNRPLLGHVLDTLKSLGIKKSCVVVGYGAAEVKKFVGQAVVTALQKEQKGTGHAVMCAENALKSAAEVLIWPGDMPLLKKSTLQNFIREHRASGASVSVLSCNQPDPYGYGRIIRDSSGNLSAIREEIDADASEKQIREVNTGIYIFDRKALFDALSQIKPNNKKGEYYLTDTIEILRDAGAAVRVFCLAAAEEAIGVNSKKDLAAAARFLTDRVIDEHMDAGIHVVSPKDTWIAPHVKIGAGTVIYPWTWIDSGTEIGADCEIGPCAKIRGGSKIGDGSIVGNFVEVNRSRIGRHVNAKHLAYLGDAVVGDGANIGAGVITANYDGKNKHVTKIGGQSLIGSNTVLVAPVNLPEKIKTGAGSVVTRGTKMRAGDVLVGIPARAVKKSS